MAFDNITALPEYPTKFAEHQVALKMAGDNEAEQLKAQLAWSEAQRELEVKRGVLNEQERSVAETKARLATEYPNVPESIYADTQDPAQMEVKAKTFADALAAAAPKQDADPGAGAGGQPPTGLGKNNDQSVAHDVISKLESKYEGQIDNAKARRKTAIEYIDEMTNAVVLPIVGNANKVSTKK